MVKHPYEIYMLLKTCNQLGLAEHAQVLLKYIKDTSLEVRVVKYALKFMGHADKVDENVLSLVIKPYLERSAIREHISTLNTGLRKQSGAGHKAGTPVKGRFRLAEGECTGVLSQSGRSLDDASRIIDILKVLKKSNSSATYRTIKQLNHAYKTSFRSIRI
jgi:hypothetical protein